MILVIDSLSKEEASEYLKAGINNTIKYETSQEALKDLSTFLKRRKDQKIKALQLKTQNINAFRLPLWKRTFDIFFSGMAILCLSPLLIFTALAIRLESKGPIIYKSKRVGSNYQIFDFLKFRSMYTDADKHLKDFNALNNEEEQYLRQLMDEYNCIAMSYGYIVDNQLMINKGPLSGRSDMVNRIDRHKRIADIEVYLWHQPKRVRVGLEIIDKITAQEYAKIKLQ